MVVGGRPLDPVALERQQVERERHRRAARADPLERPLGDARAGTSRAARPGTSGCTSRRSRPPSRRSRARTPPSEVTQSAISSARGRAHAPRPARRSGCSTPLDVSACTTATGGRRGWSSSVASRRSFGDRLAPIGLALDHDSAPQRAGDLGDPARRRSPHARHDQPCRRARAGSPRPASMPAVPVQCSGSTRPSGHRGRRAAACRRTSSRMSCSSGSRWPSIGLAHRLEHGRVHVRRAGAAEQPLRGPERGEFGVMPLACRRVACEINLRVSRTNETRLYVLRRVQVARQICLIRACRTRAGRALLAAWCRPRPASIAASSAVPGQQRAHAREGARARAPTW